MIRPYKCLLIFFLSFCPFFGWASDLAPYYPRNIEIQEEAGYRFQYYRTVETVHGFARRPAYNHFLDLSIGGAYSIYAIELGSVWAATRHRDFGCADIHLTGRYQLMDDTTGDPVSVVAGLTLTQVFKQAQEDISCFYHGNFEGEFHLAVGKEMTCWQFWESRLWGVGGFGIGDSGSPWLRGDLTWEHNCWDRHYARLAVKTLWGLGGEGLSLHHHFEGYGPIHHQSIDLCCSYSFALDCGEILTLGYAWRAYALNCPRRVSELTVDLLYPFGL